jgi:L-threonylcarbamoyladenylate synthase
MASVLRITEDDFESAVDVAHALLHSGGVFVYPTDTVYGLGGDATSEKAVERIHRIKGIKEKRPMSVMMADLGMIDYYCETGLWEDMILSRYLPGPYTFLLKKRRYLAASDSSKLGVRIPDSAFCQALCREFDKPVITTSANMTAKTPATKLDDVEKSIIDAADLVIDGGQTKYRSPSLVIDLVDGKVLREGRSESISIAELPER